MIAFARTCDAIAKTAPKLEKIAILAAYLRTLDDDDAAAAARFFTGNPFPARDERSLAIGWRTIVAAAAAVWGIDDAALAIAYRATGDLGAALGPFVQPPVDLGLFRTDALRPARLYERLGEIAGAQGKGAQRTRQILCERIFGTCTDPLEATYVVKIMTSELRIGLREGLILDAIASAFARDAQAVRRAASAAGDVGSVAIAAREDALDAIAVGYHAPIAFMLATPIAFGSEYRDLAGGTWLVEDKYDGIRVQAHVTPERVSLFSRTFSDVSGSYPEVVGALRALPGSFALDGEIIAELDGRVLPFRYLQARLQRKTVSEKLLRETPVRYVAFDALARDDDFLLERPLAERRGILAEVLAGADRSIEAAPWSALESGSGGEVVAERFAAARDRGNEGLVFKRTDAPYAPGRRGKWWLKLKRELSTLDVVVVRVEWGHGRRAKVLSDYTFAVRGSDGKLATIGKAYSGLTDIEIAEMTDWFLDHRLDEPHGHAIVVEPSIVIEVAFDIIQRSDLHGSGFALRFPRIVRLRPDKPASQIDTIERVEEIYREMLGREGVAR